jgi:hypothetical protein
VATLFLMYLNTYELTHIWFSQTPGWMALVMGAATAVMAIMLAMYRLPHSGMSWH